MNTIKPQNHEMDSDEEIAKELSFVQNTMSKLHYQPGKLLDDIPQLHKFLVTVFERHLRTLKCPMEGGGWVGTRVIRARMRIDHDKIDEILAYDDGRNFEHDEGRWHIRLRR